MAVMQYIMGFLILASDVSEVKMVRFKQSLYKLDMSCFIKPKYGMIGQKYCNKLIDR